MRNFTLVYLIVAWLGVCGAGLLPASALGASTTPSIEKIEVCTQEWANLTKDKTGLYWDIFTAVFQPLKIKINRKLMPYKRSIDKVKEKTCDIALGSYKDKDHDVLYSQWPLEIEAVIAVHASGAKFSDDSFSNKKFGWVKDYEFEDVLEDVLDEKDVKIDFTEVRSMAMGLKMLNRGEFDYFLGFEPDLKEAAEAASFDLSAYAISPVPKLSQMVYPVFRKDDRGEELVNLYSRRMAELHQDGTLDLIYAKYKSGAYPAPSDP